MQPSAILAMSPREFYIVMRADQERIFDVLQHEATVAIMHERASREKRPSADMLFKRPLDAELARERTDELLDKKRNANEWLAQFEQFQ